MACIRRYVHDVYSFTTIIFHGSIKPWKAAYKTRKTLVLLHSFNYNCRNHGGIYDDSMVCCFRATQGLITCCLWNRFMSPLVRARCVYPIPLILSSIWYHSSEFITQVRLLMYRVIESLLILGRRVDLLSYMWSFYLFFFLFQSLNMEVNCCNCQWVTATVVLLLL